MSIKDWTTDAEAKALKATLASGGPDAVEKAMGKISKGYLAFIGSLGWPINVARTYPAANGGHLQKAGVGNLRHLCEFRGESSAGSDRFGELHRIVVRQQVAEAIDRAPQPPAIARQLRAACLGYSL
jgi:hypothetical protein